MTVDRVTEYARRVVAGKVVAGSLHIAACKRHLDDLARQNTEDFPYYWDVEASQRIIEYAETLILAEGAEPRPLVLLDCQAFDLGCRFGWYNARGFRRFRRSYKGERDHRNLRGRVFGLFPRKAVYRGYEKTPSKVGLGRNGKVHKDRP